MMMFRELKAAIVALLGENEFEQFRTIGHQRQGKAAQSVKGNDRLVQVYYSSGNFPKTSGRVNASKQHKVTFRVELTVSTPAKMDLATINSSTATPSQISTALSGLAEASEVADASLDELIDIIYQIISDSRNYYLGLEKGDVSDRWIGSIQKDQPMPRGELVILTANLTLTAQVAEQNIGAVGAPGSSTGAVISTTIDIDGDDVEKTQVIQRG